MQTSGPNIYQWLVQVPKGDPPVIEHANTSQGAFEVDATLTTGALDELRDLNIQPIPRMRHPASNDEDGPDRKRLRGLREPSNKPRVAPHNQFERRPRQKTRTDKYDYKAPAPREKAPAKSGEGRSKRSKGRKHTMNDDFHASNVPPGRLTVRSSAKLGIFSKGRASSPINTRGELGFSELTFLSRKNQTQPPQHTPSDKLVNTPTQKDRHRLDYSRFDIRSSTELEWENILPGIPHTLVKSQARASIEEDMTSPAHGTGHARQRNLDSIAQAQSKVKSVEKSRSATPYTWSVTENSDSHQGRALDAHLLSLLRVGLFLRRSSEEHSHVHSKSDCCDIEELRRLLQDRKAHWEIETNVTSSHSGRKKELDGGQSPPRSSRSSIRSSPACLAKDVTESSESKDIPKPSTDLVCGNASTESRCRISISRAHGPLSLSPHHQAHLNSNDICDGYSVSDEAFFNILNAAFDAIVKPETVKPETGRLDSSQEITQDSQLSQYQAPPQPTEDSVDADLYGPRRTGYTGLFQLADHDYALRHFNSGLNAETRGLVMGDLNQEILLRSPGMSRAHHGRNPLPSSATNSHAIPTTLPVGFWRQNRLY